MDGACVRAVRTREVGEDEEGGVGLGGDEGEVLLAGDGDLDGEVEVHGWRPQRHGRSVVVVPCVWGGFAVA